MTAFHRALVAALVFAACAESNAPVASEVEGEHHHDALFTNSGFESGNLSSWTLTTNLVATSPGVTAYPVTSESQLGLRAGGVAKTVT